MGRIIEFYTSSENVKIHIQFMTVTRICSVYFESLFQSTMGWVCPDQSHWNKLLISIVTDLDPRNEISLFASLFAVG